MEHRDAHFLLQRLLDDEAFRSLDVLKVDAAERGFHRPYGSDELFGAARLEAQVEHVDIGEILEQDALAFHNRFGGVRPDVAEPEDGCAVGDHSHQIGAPGVFGHQSLILRDGLAGFRHTRRIGEGQILLAFAALGQHHFGFPVTGGTVVFKSFFPRKQGHDVFLIKNRMVKGDASDGTVTASPPLWVESPRPPVMPKQRTKAKTRPCRPPTSARETACRFSCRYRGNELQRFRLCRGPGGGSPPGRGQGAVSPLPPEACLFSYGSANRSP